LCRARQAIGRVARRDDGKDTSRRNEAPPVSRAVARRRGGPSLDRIVTLGKLPDEALPALRERLDEWRRPGVVTECLAEFADGRVQAGFGIHERLRAPEQAAELLAADDDTWASKQRDQQAEGQILELDPHAVAPQHAGVRIDVEVAEPHRPFML